MVAFHRTTRLAMLLEILMLTDHYGFQVILVLTGESFQRMIILLEHTVYNSDIINIQMNNLIFLRIMKVINVKFPIFAKLLILFPLNNFNRYDKRKNLHKNNYIYNKHLNP